MRRANNPLPAQEYRLAAQGSTSRSIPGRRALVAVWIVSCELAMAGELSGDDLRSLNRLTYGSNDSSASAYAAAGRTAFWASQLHFVGDAALPPEARAAIKAMTISRVPARDIVGAHEEEEQRLKELPEGKERQAQRKALNERYQFVLEEAQRRRIIRALYSGNQLQEQLTWFWFNHFNVFQGKGKVRLLVADYEENAIRPHVFGRFRDLLLATLMHPAMLLYLDNVQNAQGQVNENYARELLELHTLGVDGGYTQQDVQELARILTGVGVNLESKPVKLGPRDARYYVGQGMFAFHPRRHDFGEKVFLGHRISGRGFDEIAEVADILGAHPATARLISRKLAIYFMADEPPANVLQRMQDAFLGSRGDIGHTLHVLFDSSEFWRDDYLGKKFKDHVQYVFSALRLAYDGRTITNYKPVQNWLHALGEPLYSHQTPDGYGLGRRDWASAGQLTKRFEIARHIANAGPKLFGPVDADDPGDLPAGAESNLQPNIMQSRVFTLLQPLLGEQSAQALAQAKDNRDWTALFLSTPEFMYR
jgi:uncharacterized protein (DUF1800 family)